MLTKPIIAYRAWMLKNDSLMSLTCFWPNLWPHGVTYKTDRIPEKYNSNGIHAFKDLNNLVFYLEKERLYYDVIGQVYLWGEIVEHKNGYRAEFAYPKSLKIVHLDDMYSYPYVKNSPQYGKLNIEDEKQLQRNYGCEIISKDNAFAIDKV